MGDKPLVDITVKLTGTDGNSFAILGKVREALIKAGRRDLTKAFIEDATSGDRNHLLATCMKYVNVR